MTAKRDASFTLDAALADPGFTPRSKDLAGLLERAGGDDPQLAARAGAAALRVQGPIAAKVAARLHEGATDALVELAAGAAARGDATADDRAALLDALAAALRAGRASRASAAAIAQVLAGPAVARDAIPAATLDAVVEALAAASTGTDGSARKGIARALAAAGTAGARRALDAMGGDDAVVARARLAARRDADRASIDDRPRLDVAPPRPLPAVLLCRRGLEAIVADQLGAERDAHRARAGRVALSLREPPLAALEAARSALGIGFEIPAQPLRGATPEAVAEAVARGLATPQAGAILDAFATGRVRFRLAFAGGGKHRASTWAIAERVAAIPGGRWVNDPRDAPWELVVGLPPPGSTSASGPFATLELQPRFDDRRFPWRVADVPAASHPTIAAALAHLGGARDGDVVWDPFVGSGGELCERARLGPAAQLVGTDVDDQALAAARANLAAAGVEARLVRSDARDFVPSPPATLIVSNPPMGRRVLRGEGDVRRLLVEVVGRTRRTLAPGGRLVFASAHPDDTREAAHDAGLELVAAATVDLGGFDVELQSFVRR